jgi:hypothetical protein
MDNLLDMEWVLKLGKESVWVMVDSMAMGKVVGKGGLLGHWSEILLGNLWDRESGEMMGAE